MKILIISDSHGNIANIKHVMGFAKKIGVKAVIHCGDWANMEAVKTVLSYKIPLYGVLGNADIGDEIKSKFEKYLKVELGGKKIGIIHNIKYLEANDQNLDIIFFGHWQKQKEISWAGIRAINPGPLEDRIDFAVYDSTSDKIEFVKNE